jgi:hypothetical protein
MRKIMLVTPIIASAALVLLSAAPVFADTPATFTISAGGLTLSAATASVPLATVTPKAVPQNVGPTSLGSVTVTDERGGILEWTASVASTAFVGNPTGSVPPANVTYTPPAATVTGTNTVTPATVTGLEEPQAVQTAVGVTGSNLAVWSPTLTVAVPGGTVIGTFSGTVTHSVI